MQERRRLPDWIKTRGLTGLHAVKQALKSCGVSTVCESARCPNIGTCFAKPTATFMILGSRCTRDCGFCSVDSGAPSPVEPDEPYRVAQAARYLGLSYVVVTSVTRDDLADGGASHFAETVRVLKEALPKAPVEVLIPDFQGEEAALGSVLAARPDVLNHNIETVPRLYPLVRPQAAYDRSLNLLRNAKGMASDMLTKSGIIVGLGETFAEVVSVMSDIRRTGCDFLTIGQYLRPSKGNLPVVEFVRPAVFERYREIACSMGFARVASSPLVRSSLCAEEMSSGRLTMPKGA